MLPIENFMNLEEGKQEKLVADLFFEDQQTVMLRYSAMRGKDYEFDKMIYKNSKLVASKH